MHSVMLDLLSSELSAEEKEILQHPQVGGIILFTRNYESPAQLSHLLQQIKALALEHLLITVDHEGGRVQRFREGFTQLPALGQLGERYQNHPEQAKQLAETAGWLMAMELRAEQIDFSFAPVLDLNKNISEVIGDRSFNANPSIVVELASAYIKGMQRAGMSAVGKHFPGHGSVKADSHIAIPIDPRSYEKIAAEDLIPFERLCRNNLLEGIMPAHVIYSEVDVLPAGFSKFWLQKVLRERLQFDGAIFSDDLSMEGATQVGDMNERARIALDAGCDMILVCNNRKAAISVLEYLERKPVMIDKKSASRLRKLQGRGEFNRHELKQSAQWREAVLALQKLT